MEIVAATKVDTKVALMTLKKELVGFGVAKMNAMKIYKAKSGIMVNTNKIFMERGTYPRWTETKRTTEIG